MRAGPRVTVQAGQMLEDSKLLCLAPWVHAHLSTLGQFLPCCEFQGSAAGGDAATLGAHWNGAPLASIRKAMLEGKRIAACMHCYDKEAAGLPSLRQHFNERYREEGYRLLATGPDGTLATGIEPIDADIRFSNICNFRCRSCWHGSSSRWFADAAALGQAKGDQAIIAAGGDRDQILEELKQRLPSLRTIYFAGGEPLLMEQHYIILEELIRIGRTDIGVSYHSNLSELGLGDRSATALWKRLANVHVRISADGMGATGELIRKGLDWNLLRGNVRLIRDACPHVRLSIAVTVSVLNLFHIPAFYTHLREALGFDAEEILLNPLQSPPHYNIQILPRRMKTAAALRLQELAEPLHGRAGARTSAEFGRRAGVAGVLDLITYMNARDMRQHILGFVAITDRLDALRGEDSFATIPELHPLRSAARRAAWAPRRRAAAIGRALRRMARSGLGAPPAD